MLNFWDLRGRDIRATQNKKGCLESVRYVPRQRSAIPAGSFRVLQERCAGYWPYDQQ